MAELVDDLAQLSSIDDSVVMATLKTRHEKDEIYTKNGAVLIAINPYKTIHLYDDGKLAQYKGSMSLESEPPHIFAVSATAHRAMISNGVNQALVISGESGAGKTESARFILQYLRYVSNASHGLEEKVYKSQPVTEAFGCAKTVRNDNSSRFGKFLKLYFDKSARIKARLPPSAPPRPGASPPAHRPPSEPGGARLGRRARAGIPVPLACSRLDDLCCAGRLPLDLPARKVAHHAHRQRRARVPHLLRAAARHERCRAQGYPAQLERQ